MFAWKRKLIIFDEIELLQLHPLKTLHKAMVSSKELKWESDINWDRSIATASESQDMCVIDVEHIDKLSVW